MNCPDCHFSAPTIQSVAKHAARVHKKPSKQLYVEMVCNGVEPTCACGCGASVRWQSITHGFWTYKTGHNSRVDNPYNKPEVRAKQRTETSRAHKEGRVTYWTRGKSKESDERIAKSAEKASQTILNDPEKRKTRSDRMCKGRLDGTVRTLKGPEHPQWNGGTSSLSAHCHGSHLYEMWKFPLLKAASFKCRRCSSTRDLHVHHTGERMADIVRRFAVEAGYTGEDDQELKHIIARRVAEYHRDARVSGDVLCHTCHGDEHPSLNF